MANKTKIEWCDLSLNPIIGCSPCSPGCLHCYAEKRAWRLAHNKNTPQYKEVVTDGKWNGRQCWVGHALDSIPSDKNPKRIFIGSMTDVFLWLDNVGTVRSSDSRCASLNTIMDTMMRYQRHTFMLLTKRPEGARRYLNAILPMVPNNLWLGVTVCNQDEADEKIPILLSTPAAKRFVSIEPMLGPIQLGDNLVSCNGCGNEGTIQLGLNKTGSGHDLCRACGKEPGPGLDWIIVGGETGPGARPMDPDWARSIRDQCKAAGVPFFFKQVSGKALIPDDLMIREVPE